MTKPPLESTIISRFNKAKRIESTGITSVDLFGLDIETQSMPFIIENLEKTKGSVELNLGKNMLCSKAVKKYFPKLMHCKNLIGLYLAPNFIGNSGGQVIAEELEKNSTLQALDIGSNAIRNKGTKAIAQALANNRTLRTLLVEGISPNDKSLKHFIKLLTSNPTITTFQAIIEAPELKEKVTDLSKRNQNIYTWGTNILLTKKGILATLSCVVQQYTGNLPIDNKAAADELNNLKCTDTLETTTKSYLETLEEERSTPKGAAHALK